MFEPVVLRALQSRAPRLVSAPLGSPAGGSPAPPEGGNGQKELVTSPESWRPTGTGSSVSHSCFITVSRQASAQGGARLSHPTGTAPSQAAVPLSGSPAHSPTHSPLTNPWGQRVTHTALQTGPRSPVLRAPSCQVLARHLAQMRAVLTVAPKGRYACAHFTGAHQGFYLLTFIHASSQ